MSSFSLPSLTTHLRDHTYAHTQKTFMLCLNTLIWWDFYNGTREESQVHITTCCRVGIRTPPRCVRSIVIAIILCPPGKKTTQFPMSCNETEPPHFNSKLGAMQRTFQGNIAAQLEFD